MTGGGGLEVVDWRWWTGGGGLEVSSAFLHH